MLSEAMKRAGILACAVWCLTIAIMGLWGVYDGHLKWQAIPLVLIPQGVLAIHAIRKSEATHD